MNRLRNKYMLIVKVPLQGVKRDKTAPTKRERA